MKTIPEHFVKNGFHYRLLKRTEVGAIYTQSTIEVLPDDGKVCAYEVVRIRVREERTVNASSNPGRPQSFTIAGGEYLPSTNEWGTHGWTYSTLTQALLRLCEIGASNKSKSSAAA